MNKNLSRCDALFEQDDWSKDMMIPLMLGETFSGKKAVLDLAKAPHILIAGKATEEISMGLNVMVMSLINRFSPEDLHLVLFHPQEDVFANLQIPVIHNTQQIITELRETAVELDRRYKILAAAGVKTLRIYNDIKNAKSSKLPCKILFIGELAMLWKDQSWSSAETNICRIAQRGRAAGIHIIAATRYPDPSIISGSLKANLPVRIVFRVDTVNESRTILNASGAENLIGGGDMLLMSDSDTKRIKCAAIPNRKSAK